MNVIQEIYEKITLLSTTSPIVAGAISLWGLTVVTFMFKNVPLRIFTFIKKQVTSTLEFDNAQGYEHREIYTSCMEWFYKNKTALKLSRTLSIYSKGVHDGNDHWRVVTTIGPGYGTHIFFFNKRLMWMTLNELPSTGSEVQKRSVKITCFGRNKNVFSNFVDAFTPKIKEDDVFIHTYTMKGWVKDSILIKRPIESVAMDEKIKNKFISDIDHFNNQEDWFISRGLPYKLTYVLHGEPGTGKTSWVKAIASYFRKDVCIINISDISDTGFQTALSTVPKNSILLIEDFDSSSSTKSRISVGDEEKNSINFSFLSLTGILNGLDGVKSLHNTIVILTTNHLENVDKAIYRQGRVDSIVELKKVPSIEVKRYSEFIFSNEDFSHINFEDTLGCLLNSSLLTSKGDKEKYLESLENYWRGDKV